MNCFECGEASYIEDSRDMAYAYKGKSTIIPAVTGEYCTNCNVPLLPYASYVRTENAKRAFEAMIDGMAELPTVEQLANTGVHEAVYVLVARMFLGLTLDEASQLFGYDKETIKEYESGTVIPPAALVKLCKLLIERPELLEDVRKL